MLGNSFCSHAAKEVCSVSSASSTTSCHICFQTSSSWLKVCGEGNAHSKNWNILSWCTQLISWRFLGIKYIPHAVWTCICENLNSNSESKWSIEDCNFEVILWTSSKYVASFCHSLTNYWSNKFSLSNSSLMCSILPNTFIKHLITILSQDLQLCQLAELYWCKNRR